MRPNGVAGWRFNSRPGDGIVDAQEKGAYTAKFAKLSIEFAEACLKETGLIRATGRNRAPDFAEAAGKDVVGWRNWMGAQW